MYYYNKHYYDVVTTSQSKNFSIKLYMIFALQKLAAETWEKWVYHNAKQILPALKKVLYSLSNI